MGENKKSKEKICSFYASDYHFEMISLPYIEKMLEKNKNIIILTENNLEDTANKLINRINLKKDKKEKLFKIDWNNDYENKIKKIQKNNNLIVFIKGKKDYIKNTNEKLEKIVNNKEIKIIDCYNIEEVANDYNDITKNYKKSLNTMGVKEIEKI